MCTLNEVWTHQYKKLQEKLQKIYNNDLDLRDRPSLTWLDYSLLTRGEPTLQ